jgi:Curli production assembly/transport component CsgG
MKKTLITLLLSIFSLTAFSQNPMEDKIKALAIDVADQIVAQGGTKVAVTALDYKNCNTEFGKYLAEELTGYLSTSGKKVTIVNQKMLEALLVQNRLTAKGLLEAKNDAAKLGQASGINAIVYGTITSLGEDLKISLSVVKLPTLEVYGFAKSSLSLTNGIKNMLVCQSENNMIEREEEDDPDPKVEKSKDKNCNKTHTGTFIFLNNTAHDINLNFNDGHQTRDFIIKSKNKEVVEGIYSGKEGVKTIRLRVKKDLKASLVESQSIYIEECKVKTHIIK